MEAYFEEILNNVWKELFGEIPMPDKESLEKLLTKGIVLPVKVKCEVDGKDIFINSEYGYKRFICDEDRHKQNEINNGLFEKKALNGLEDVLREIRPISLFRGNRSLNSDAVVASDDIYSSNMVYASTHIYGCQKVLWSNNCVGSEYLVASTGSKNCTFGMRVVDTGGSTNCYDVSFMGQSANCYFCHDSINLSECMFCFNLESRSFCIANMQFEEAEYRELKKKILLDYWRQVLQTNAFVGLADLK